MKQLNDAVLDAWEALEGFAAGDDTIRIEDVRRDLCRAATLAGDVIEDDRSRSADVFNARTIEMWATVSLGALRAVEKGCVPRHRLMVEDSEVG
ncbi:MAG: hypothetical protein ABEN55_11990 [Bradymonadaceae bacterium]